MFAYLCLGGNDLALSDTLALCGHRKRFLEFLAENNVLDEHAFDLDTPAGCYILNDFTNGLGHLLAAFNNVLEDTSTNYVAKSGLGTLDKSLTNVCDTESGNVRGDDVVVDDGGEAEGDVVFGHANLLWDFGDLNLDIDLDEVLAERVDLDKTGVDGPVELSKLGDETNVTLLDSLKRVGTADAAGDSSHGTHAGTKSIDYKKWSVVGTS